MLAEVARGVEELLGHDRGRSRASASATRSPLSSAPPRSKYSRIVGTSSTRDLVAVEHADAPAANAGFGVLNGHKLHVLSSVLSADAQAPRRA